MGRNFEDEFNKGKVTNERDVFKNEFAQNKNVEFTYHRDNSLPKDEYTSKDKSSLHAVNNENIQQKLTEKAVETTGQTVTVTSSATASSIAATSSTVVAAASTVAIVAIGTVTGISVALHNYEYRFDSFIVSANELTYELVITDANQKDEEELLSYEDLEKEKDFEEEQPFTLRVYNATYDYSHSLWLGYNYNTFTGLELGQTYNIVLSENRYGGETLFSETFTTIQNTKFISFSIPGSANFIDKTFDVTMDFVDNSNSFSDFTLYLEDSEYPEEVYVEYALMPQSGTQQVSTTTEYEDCLDLHRTYNYRFSYKDRGEPVDFDEGQVSFYDVSGAMSEFRSLSIGTLVDFAESNFNVTLDYIDELNEMGSFCLMLTDSETSENIYIYLDNSIEPQQIDINTYGIDFTKEYTYEFSYYNYNDYIVFESGDLIFEDVLGRESHFDGLDMKAYFMTDEIVFTLNYVDDLHRYDNFVLTLTTVDGEHQTEISLDTTIDPQNKKIKEYDISSELSYTYVLTADYMGEQKVLINHTEPYTFTDSSVGTSEVHDLMIIGKEAKYSNRTFNVKLEYEDDFHFFDEFVMVINDLETGGTLEIPLDTTTDEQLVSANEMTVNEDTGEKNYVVNILVDSCTFNVRYLDRGETKYLYDEDQELVLFDEEFLGVDTYSDGVVISGDSENGYRVGMKFNFRDNADVYADINPVFYEDDTMAAQVDINADTNFLEWNYCNLFAFGSDDSYIETLIGKQLRLVVTATIYNAENDYHDEMVTIFDKETTLYRANELEPEIYGVYMDEYVIGSNYEGNIRNIIFTCDVTRYEDCQLVLTSLVSNREYIYNFTINEEGVSLLFSSPASGTFYDYEFEEDLNGEFRIEIIYSIYVEDGTAGSDSSAVGPTYALDGPHTFTCYESFKFTLSV